MNKKAFTFVELIVVVTILSILAAIWFASYSSYISWSRDTNRTTQLKSLKDSLNIQSIKSRLPEVEEWINITNWIDFLWTQWVLGEIGIVKIWFSSDWVDPKDKTYFSYYLLNNKKTFQLMAFLENDQENEIWYLKNNYLNANYSESFAYVEWSKLWILTDENNVPLHELWLTWDIDLSNLWWNYISHISNSKILTWSQLSASSTNYSCERLFEVNSKKNSWQYNINQDGIQDIQVYCHNEHREETFYPFVVDWGFEWDLEKNWDTSVSLNGSNIINTSIFNSWLKSLETNWKVQINSKNYTYIVPWKTYNIEWFFRSIWSKQSDIYFWFKEYDKELRFIGAPNVLTISWTESKLTKKILIWDTNIEFEDSWNTCNNWLNWTYFSNYATVAFNTDNSWNFNDLPNYDLSLMWFDSVTDMWNYCRLSLKNEISKEYVIWTKIRMHSSWWSYNYIWAGWTNVNFNWQNFSWEINWISKHWISNLKFRRGTKFIKLVILANHYWTDDETLLIDDLKLVESWDN